MRQAFTLIELMIVIAIIAIIAAIAIPNLLESRISSNEAAAATSLKSGLHPAQVQFQAGNYCDDPTVAGGGAAAVYSRATNGGAAGAPAGAGGNGIGDFAGQFNQMCTTGVLLNDVDMVGASLVVVSLLPSVWADIPGQVYAPSAGTGASLVVGPNINNYIFSLGAVNENNFVASCAPSNTDGSVGRRIFSINASGTVYTTGAEVAGAALALPTCIVPFGAGMSTPDQTAGAAWIVNKK